ncbi:unnamed protein product [Tenebrio molitor]|nr:unnamed protein product [Tenebrio molitor]
MNFLIMTDSKNARETPFRYQTGRERGFFLQKFLHRVTKPQRSMKYLFFLDNLFGTKFTHRIYLSKNCILNCFANILAN